MSVCVSAGAVGEAGGWEHVRCFFVVGEAVLYAIVPGRGGCWIMLRQEGGSITRGGEETATCRSSTTTWHWRASELIDSLSPTTLITG